MKTQKSEKAGAILRSTLASLTLLLILAAGAIAQVKVSELPATTTATGADTYLIVQGGITKRILGSNLSIGLIGSGSTNIVNLGTVTNGTWAATPVGLAYGGTGATNAAGARAALGLDTAATNPAIAFATASQGLLAASALQPGASYTNISGLGTAATNAATNFAPASGSTNYASASRTISAGAGLSGGGDLSANRSISLAQNIWDSRFTSMPALSLKLYNVQYGAMFRAAVVGDSLANARRGALQDLLWTQYGYGGYGLNQTTVRALSGNATNSTSDFSTWINGDVTTIPVGGSAIWDNSSLGVLSTHLAVAYVKESGAGTFKIERSSDNGSTWTDAATGISANGSTAGAFYKLAALAPAYYSMRVTNTGGSGSVKIIGCVFEYQNPVMTAFRGGLVHNLTRGGADLSQFSTAPASIVSPIIGALAPDLVWFNNVDAPSVGASYPLGTIAAVGDWASYYMPILYDRIRVADQTVSAIAYSGGYNTLTVADSSLFSVGNTIRVSGSNNSANDGVFSVTALPSGTTVQVLNLNGVSETPSSCKAYPIPDWVIVGSGPSSTFTDRIILENDAYRAFALSKNQSFFDDLNWMPDYSTRLSLGLMLDTIHMSNSAMAMSMSLFMSQSPLARLPGFTRNSYTTGQPSNTGITGGVGGINVVNTSSAYATSSTVGGSSMRTWKHPNGDGVISIHNTDQALVGGSAVPEFEITAFAKNFTLPQALRIRKGYAQTIAWWSQDGAVKLGASLAQPSSWTTDFELQSSGYTRPTLRLNAPGNGSAYMQEWWSGSGATFTSAVSGIDNPGNFVARVAGVGIKIKEGSNARMGTATLANGTVTVTNTSVTASSRAFLTRAAVGSSTAIGSLSLGTVSAGTNFVINSLSSNGSVEAGDQSTVNWMLVEPAP